MTDQSTAPQPKSDNEPQESDESQESIAIPENEGALEELSTRILEKLSVTISAGPIPPPDRMEQYEKTLPGSADRILKMAENQSEHRQSLEKQRLSFSNREVHLGQGLGFLTRCYRHSNGRIYSPRWSSNFRWIHWYNRSCRSCGSICYWE